MNPARLLQMQPARLLRLVLGVGVLTALAAQTGCAIPQPRGAGRVQYLHEPTTRRGYWLYLPEDYVKADEAGRMARTWPLVVTFHGMRPFDVASYQIREWQQEADRYGFIVIAPDLRSADVFAQFPLRTVHPGVKADEEATLAIMEHIFRTTHADRNAVLSTGFSSGGYMAHYMVNRHPDAFTVLAPRQANFSKTVLSVEMARQSRYTPILIMNTQNDFKICKSESAEAVAWYERLGFQNMFWIHINHLGHERTPDLAADFFARVIGVKPKTPPKVLARRQTIDGNAEGLAFLEGNMSSLKRPPRASRQQPVRAVETRESPVSIRVSSAFGVQPFHLAYWVTCPESWLHTANFAWTLNGESIGQGANGQKTIADPGEYTLALTVTTADNQRHSTSRPIRVLPQFEAALASD